MLRAVRTERIERNDLADGRLATCVQGAALFVIERRATSREPQVEPASREQHVIRVRVCLGQAMPEPGCELLELGSKRADRLQRARDALNRQAAEERVLMMEQLRDREFGRRVAAFAASRAVVRPLGLRAIAGSRRAGE